ncbi:MAG: hypothetical protein GWP14_05430 [Actinobacteria bacterium]|nr:hypothetical protein [Actinomycetota bacterium]
MELRRLEVLSDGEVKQIHEATLDILENCGVQVQNTRMLSLLEGKGLQVNHDKQLVRFSRTSLEDALSHIPAEFEVYDREGEFAFTLGDGKPKIAAGHNAVFWVDAATGHTRPSKVSDVAMCARICDQLECIDVIGIPVMPQDVPDPQKTLLYGVKATVRNSRKPIYFSTDSCQINRAIIDLLEAAFRGDLKTQVYGISQLSPTSPLYWEEGVIDAIMDTVKTGVPLAILPEPNAGVSCPYTLAGLLTMNNAECISGLAMIQMLKPGAKVMYANSWTTTDMRTGAALVGSTETTICRIAAAQLARFYKTPSHTTAPNSDNHAHDEQNSWEKTLSMFCSVGAGHDLIVNCGMFATGMTFSHEQLIMDEEISAMSRRIARGISVTDETLARDLIEQIGPRGDYLTSNHTLKWLRSNEYLLPRVSIRGPYAVWQAAGAKDTYLLAQEKVREYEQLPGSPLAADRAARLDEIISSF